MQGEQVILIIAHMLISLAEHRVPFATTRRAAMETAVLSRGLMGDRPAADRLLACSSRVATVFPQHASAPLIISELYIHTLLSASILKVCK